MKTINLTNKEILTLKEYLNCNPCESHCIINSNIENCDELDKNGNYKCSLKQNTKSIMDKLGISQ